MDVHDDAPRARSRSRTPRLVSRPYGRSPSGPPDEELDRAAHTARQRQYQTYALLGILSFVAGGAAAAGAIVANPVFWIAAGAVFFLASAGIIAWAAKQLGVIAELIDLFRLYRERQSSAAEPAPILAEPPPSAGSHTTPALSGERSTDKY
jgi:hypothetical protein